ncbi:MAG: hypothetical protein ER33_09070 [Cyanobium sp. CACIAM 14]|nr:MAG: hypothetical protein ER33_09070 [Cyanobium sp. CACIAM 14]
MAASLQEPPLTLPETLPSLLSLLSVGAGEGRSEAQRNSAGRGFGSRSGSPGSTDHRRPSGVRGRRRKGTGLSAADHGPLGRSPGLDSIEARSRLGLPLAGRLRESDVSAAWKRAAAEHHPDRGGRHATMQAVNAARDVLLGRGLE